MRSPRLLSSLLLAGLLVAGLAGCRPTQPPATPVVEPPPRGPSTQTIAFGGANREFRVYVPSSLALTAAVPLVVMLHGGFGSAEQAQQTYGWDGAADRYGFVVAYPDGVNHAWAVGDGCCGEPGRSGTDDAGFIKAAVADLAARLPIDPARVFATGISNGAMMSYRLACESNTFAAIAPVAGTLLGSCPEPKALSVLHIHGLADENVPFDGSPGTGFAKIDGPDVLSTVDVWRQADRCQAPSVVTADPVTTSLSVCPEGRAVELIMIAGAGHQWPGGPTRTVAQRVLGLDEPSTALDATETIWRFFTAHSRP